MSEIVRKYGWQKSDQDHRDFKLYLSMSPIHFPDKVDFRPECPPVYNQLNIGSCTANAWDGLYEWLLIKEKLPHFVGSRLFCYYNERVLDGTPVTEDSGSQLRTGAKVLSQFGVPDENLWPYVEDQFAVKPPYSVYEEASKNKLHKYLSIDNSLNTLMSCLAQGYPFVFGFVAFEALESPQVAREGILPMPHFWNRSIGGHAVMCVGYIYINNRLYFIIRNSWGDKWGMDGYFLMPADYITNKKLASDFWTVRVD